jgi:adenosine deaminase
VDAFVPVLQRARQSKLALSIHVAEIPNYEETKVLCVLNPLTVEKLLALNPDRIGHAVCLNESLVEQMFENPIPLELCLTSNMKTHTVDSYLNHHFKDFYANYPIVLCVSLSVVLTI